MPTAGYFIQNAGSPEFAVIRTRLALTFVEHKADIGAAS
jgi:hypothetical protein